MFRNADLIAIRACLSVSRFRVADTTAGDEENLKAIMTVKMANWKWVE